MNKFIKELSKLLYSLHTTLSLSGVKMASCLYYDNYIKSSNQPQFETEKQT